MYRFISVVIGLMSISLSSRWAPWTEVPYLFFPCSLFPDTIHWFLECPMNVILILHSISWSEGHSWYLILLLKLRSPNSLIALMPDIINQLPKKGRNISIIININKFILNLFILNLYYLFVYIKYIYIKFTYIKIY